ncbi:hypothetical protein H4S07_000471 [Coemansia furcata]|uniref:Uncharacterized protein n=1 Tax=Coemansia furcata TaxID=417177 RepID=A0ACC1LS81_9FUNG|nr:hypothetical protein H4S07_000471 [Coemansia furcata]
MKATKDTEFQRRAFRVDISEKGFSVPIQQAPAADVDRLLLQLLQPADPTLRTQAAKVAEASASAIDFLVKGHLAWALAVLTRLRRTPDDVTMSLVDIADMLESESALMFAEEDWDRAAVPDIIQAGMDVVCSLLPSECRPAITCADDVVDRSMSFEIGSRSGNAVLGVPVRTAADVKNPFTPGTIEEIVAVVDRHARRHVAVRYAWVVILGPGCVRVCLAEPDAIHFSAVKSTTTPAGRLLLGAVVAHAAFSEPWRLGGDSTMKWLDSLQRWEIDCPGTDGELAQIVFARREPLFIAETFFGRFTRCFAVSLSPDDSYFNYVFKDSWQLVATDVEDAELCDDIGVLRGMHAALDKVQCDGAELHRRMVSGPVGVALDKLGNERDISVALAGAMVGYAAILRHTGFMHHDISLGNIMAVKKCDGSVEGMLIDFDMAITQADVRALSTHVHVGTLPFMSIAGLECLKVTHTAADNWEAALALLFCLVTRSEKRNALDIKIESVDVHGEANLRREMFASRESLDAAIKEFVDPTCIHAIRLIRELYSALFEYPSCPGTAEFILNCRPVDPISERVKHETELHERCAKVVVEHLAQFRRVADLKPDSYWYTSFSPASSGCTLSVQVSPDKSVAFMVRPSPASPISPTSPALSASSASPTSRNKRKRLDYEQNPQRVKRSRQEPDVAEPAPPIPNTSEVPLVSVPSVAHNKRKADESIRSELRVKRHKPAYDDNCSAQANFASRSAPAGLGADVQGHGRSSATSLLRQASLSTIAMAQEGRVGPPPGAVVLAQGRIGSPSRQSRTL